MTLGEQIRALRLHNNMTQEVFAEKLGVSRSAVAKWEANHGIPEIGSLKIISKMFHVSLDDLLNDESGISTSEVNESHGNSEYSGYRCDIDLVGWNDGVYDVLVLSEDIDFFFYRKTEKGKMIHGLIGKRYIKSIERHSQCELFSNNSTISRDYFCKKHVLIEIAHDEGLLRGFFDFRNDDYLDVVVDAFEDSEVLLEFNRTIEIEKVTKIEEIHTKNC